RKLALKAGRAGAAGGSLLGSGAGAGRGSGIGATAVSVSVSAAEFMAAFIQSSEDAGAEVTSATLGFNSAISPKPSSSACFTTLATIVASTSGDAGGATPSSSSSLAIRYPSSL